MFGIPWRNPPQTPLYERGARGDFGWEFLGSIESPSNVNLFKPFPIVSFIE